MDFQLTIEQSLLKSRARAFARQAILPQAAYYDRHASFPWEIFRAAQAQGLLHLCIPTTYGGSGQGIFEQALVCEEFAWSCAGICAAINLNSLAISALLLAGTPDQQHTYLARLRAGELCSFALTEPEAGSDVAALQTTAMRTAGDSGEHYVLNGRKIWITNAPEAHFFLLFARTTAGEGTRGISAFFVERTAPGLTVGPPLGMLGQRAACVAEVRLRDVEVPLTALLGPPGKGFSIAMQTFNASRPLVAAYGVGLIQRCLDEALAYASKRRSMGQPILEHQAIGHKIAEIGMRLEAARLLTYQAAWLYDAGHPSVPIRPANDAVASTPGQAGRKENVLQASYAKAFAAETAVWASSEVLQIFGGAGYSTDFPIEKLFRDAKLLTIYEGTTEIQRSIMKKELARHVL